MWFKILCEAVQISNYTITLWKYGTKYGRESCNNLFEPKKSFAVESNYKNTLMELNSAV